MQGLLKRRLAAVRGRVERACARFDRDPSGVSILAVTKSVAPEVAVALREIGQEDLGENRIEGLDAKTRHFQHRGLAARWHFIGHLQRNKARRVVRQVDVIHSVDRMRLLDTLDRVASEEGRRPAVYLQVALVQGPQRSGFDPSEVPAALELAASLENLEVLGLMTMAVAPGATAPGPDDPAHPARRTFRALAALRDELPARAFRGGRARLSMGMSDDLEAAVAEGSDVVRIGTALYRGLDPASGRRDAPEVAS